MAKATEIKTFTVRVDAETHEKAAALFDELGMDLSSAIRVFLRQSVREEGLPFKPTTASAPRTEYERLKLD